MSKLYSEPKTIKNGHLTQKLQSFNGGTFSENPLSHPHIHQGTEEFLMLEGELTDDDGTVFQAGDFVRFEPNSEHSSFSENGCTALVILSGGTNKAL